VTNWKEYWAEQDKIDGKYAIGILKKLVSAGELKSSNPLLIGYEEILVKDYERRKQNNTL
jgi:hypothetical protein